MQPHPAAAIWRSPLFPPGWSRLPCCGRDPRWAGGGKPGFHLQECGHIGGHPAVQPWRVAVAACQGCNVGLTLQPDLIIGNWKLPPPGPGSESTV
ncbi:hypothetical protein NDU88_004913 [Pleurodeles waltl]|uniref:Uncharacterized protein n=1 Tax=Pleurodeles waltl TaxID=8319 RepID=A0AAV7TV33_PLEWA|nr:hypothetical protein NDU88_004913 [Pleurodeles waltl]